MTARLDLLRDAFADPASVVTGGLRRAILFVSATDGTRRADVFGVAASSIHKCWELAGAALAARGRKETWLRVDLVDHVEKSSWRALRARLAETKRGYFRLGIALDADFRHAFLETELNANAMLHGRPDQASAILNEANFRRYAAQRHPDLDPDFADERAVWLFTTQGAFIGEDGVVHPVAGQGLEAGRRAVSALDSAALFALIDRSSRYLATQVQTDGRFHYGWHPCFDRPIAAYNGLRHASSLYAMIEAFEVTRDPGLGRAIERSLAYLVNELIRYERLPNGAVAAFLVDSGAEIKLGGNAVAILALAKYTELAGEVGYAKLLDALGTGILFMQDRASGAFVHVLNHPGLTIRQPYRTIYYDGEAAFALMRLHALTGDTRWLAATEKAFEHFIRAEHWRAHDHWLGYATDELTRVRPEAAYFRFGIDNVKDHLDFVSERITTFPTLLELMMAAEKMIARMRGDPADADSLANLDLPRFYDALHKRARRLLDGHFWPELAMYFAAPAKIAGSFFIRHHGFRVRIDDVEHYLSGLIAYRAYMLGSEAMSPAKESPAAPRESCSVQQPVTYRPQLPRHSSAVRYVGGGVLTTPAASRAVARMSCAAKRASTAAERRLVDGARQLLRARTKMGKMAPGLLRDAAWDMMLALFISHEEGGVIYVKQLMLSSGESSTAAIRRIDRLESSGFLERFPDPLDRRRVIVGLTERSRTAMLAMLSALFGTDADAFHG